MVRTILPIALLSFVVVMLHAAQEKERIVRSVHVSGNDVTQEVVVLREMRLSPGRVFDESLLQRDRDRIYSLQLFNKVEMHAATAGDSVDIAVEVVERWYFFPHPIFGFKYRDLDKLFYGAGITNANFRGRNEKLSASAVTGYDRWLSLAFQTPRLTDGDDIYFRSALSYRNLHDPGVTGTDFEQTNTSGAVSLGKRFGLYRNVILTYGYDRWEVGSPLAGRTVSVDGRDEFASLALWYSFDSRNIREYATEGTAFTFFCGQSGFGGSSVDLFNYGMDIRQYVPLGEASAFALKAYGNATAGGPMPAYRHVYMGLDNKLRGYYRDRFEGENVIGGSAELRMALIPPTFVTLDFIPWKQFNTIRYGVYAALFADAGKIWYRANGASAVPARTGYGAGLHWLLAYSFVLRTEVAVNDTGREEFILDVGASF